MNKEKVIIENELVQAISPEGVTASMNLKEFCERLMKQQMDTCGVILPDGVKCIISRGPITIWIYEMSPRIASLRWIAKDSKVPYGKEAKYRTVRIALPYVCVLAVFARAYGKIQLTHRNECFFKNKPLKSLNEELMYPALLNCSKFSTEEGKPLSWICTQHLDLNSLTDITNQNQYMRAALSRLISCLWESSFNLSSEIHEGASWFSESVRRNIDSRISTIENWDEATKNDPLFVLNVPWLNTNRTVEQVAERIFQHHNARHRRAASTSDFARIVFNRNKYQL